MKKRFTGILAALALLVGLTIPMGMWGQNSHTIGWGAATGDEGTYTNFTSTSGSVQGILSFSTAKNSSQTAPAYNANSSELRLYYASNGQGGSITIVPVSGVTITEAVMTTSTTPSVAYSVDGGTAVNVSATNNNTYTISDISVTQSLMIQNVNTTNTQLRISTIALTYTTGGAAVTYTVTYDCNGGTSDCPDDLTDVEAGSSISLASAPIRSGYTFNGWSDGDNTYQAGDAYTVNGDVTFTAQWVEDGVLVFDLSSNPGGWPTDNPTTLTEYTYTLNNVSYTFALKNVKCNSGYLMMTSVAVLGLPAIEGYKLTKVVAYNSNSCSTSTKVGISSSASEASYIEGGAIQTWSNTGSQYTYNLTSTVANTMYYMYVTNKNAQLLSLALKYELDNDPAVATSVTIDASGITNTNVFESTAAGSLSATVKDNENNPINGAAVTWTSSNEEVATIAADGTVTLVAAGTTTITAAYAGVENQYRPSQGTYELTVTNEDPNAPGTLNNPYTVAQARAAIDAGTGTQGVYATGIVCTASPKLYSNKYLSYYISEDGSEDSDQLEAYNGLGIDGANFTSVDDVQVGDIVVIYGNLTKHNTTYEFAADNQLVSLERPQSTDPSITFDPDVVDLDAAQHLTLQVPFTYENLVIEDYHSFTVQFYDTNNEPTTKPDWIFSASVTGTNDEGYNVTLTVISANEGEARSSYFKVYVGETYSNLVTINQAAYVAPFEPTTYTLATSIESGKTYIITDGLDRAMGVQNGTVRSAADVTIDESTATVNTADVYEFVISGNETDGYTIFDSKASGYLYASSSSSNNIGTRAENSDANSMWAIESGDENGVTITAKGDKTRNSLRYNYNQGNDRFSCYGSNSSLNATLYLFVKEETPTNPTITVNGYGDTNGGYVLLAWPENISPDNIDGMISDDLGAQAAPATATYDLYSYDESQEKEWRNYRTNSFNLVPGKGYLYASKEGVTLTYEGEANPDFDDVDDLPYTENDLVKSIYLAGNSKTNEQTFYVYNSELAKQTFNYLTMNEDGDGFISGQGASYTAPAMTGFFVQAPGAGMTLSTTDVNAKANASLLNINVLRSRGSVIDNAIVSFSNGSMMDKFYLKNNTTRVYIPQGNREMAIANSAAEAEMPVSFRASENGTYTLAVEAENVEMNYLHLIDNLTGMDVDLLQTPSYTFEAKTSDYASRFRLVFKANSTNENNAETFAYFNGTNWTVSNVGDATLQVVDVTGRTVANQMINGNAELNLNQPAGVYVIRLVNGDNVKTQKVVVR